MPRIFAVHIALLATVTVTPSARAESGARGLAQSPVIIDADRLMPLLTYESVTITDPNSKNSVTLSGVSASVLNSGSRLTFYTRPRIGIDSVVGSGVTVGASAWVGTDFSQDVSEKIANTSVQPNGRSDPKTTYWGVAPRVGWILPLHDAIAFWPRAGVEYHKSNTSTVTNRGTTSGGDQQYQFALDIDATLVLLPFDHFGVTVTAYGAIPLVGGISGPAISPSRDNAAYDQAQLAIGATVGVLGYY
jgi:hypothetical protein